MATFSRLNGTNATHITRRFQSSRDYRNQIRQTRRSLCPPPPSLMWTSHIPQPKCCLLSQSQRQLWLQFMTHHLSFCPSHSQLPYEFIRFHSQTLSQPSERASEEREKTPSRFQITSQINIIIRIQSVWRITIQGATNRLEGAARNIKASKSTDRKTKNKKSIRQFVTWDRTVDRAYWNMGKWWKGKGMVWTLQVRVWMNVHMCAHTHHTHLSPRNRFDFGLRVT